MLFVAQFVECMWIGLFGDSESGLRLEDHSRIGKQQQAVKFSPQCKKCKVAVIVTSDPRLSLIHRHLRNRSELSELIRSYEHVLLTGYYPD